MDKLLLWVSVLASFPEAFAQKDLSRKVFLFPRESSTDHVNLITKLEKPLQNFTLCFRAYSDLSCEIQFVYQGSYSLNPTILNWQALNYEMKGYIVIKPLVWG
uniref:Pentraxin (PTX) domain-containing protein n=1 Tax=Balaenoptera musculus TaxID=9771 RepID=A0A8C0HV99_BALMU